MNGGETSGAREKPLANFFGKDEKWLTVTAEFAANFSIDSKKCHSTYRVQLDSEYILIMNVITRLDVQLVQHHTETIVATCTVESSTTEVLTL